MAAPPSHRRGRGRFGWVQRVIYGLIAVSFGICIVTPLAFMCIKNPSVTCPSCYCDCSYQDFLPIPCQFIHYNSSVAEIDPEMIKELSKGRSTLIKEELDLVKIVSEENMQRHQSLMASAKQSSSHYKKEGENCKVGVGKCEQARERAQEKLVEERKLTALWRKRAETLATL